VITEDQLLISFLKAVPLLGTLKEEMLAQLVSRVDRVFIKGGEWVFRKGQLGSNLYIIRSGLVEVVAEHATPPTILRILGRSEFFGELALIERAPHSASIRALRDTELLKIHQTDFIKLIEENPEVSLDLSRYLCRRLLNQKLTGTIRASASKRSQYIGVLTLFVLHQEVSFNHIRATIQEKLAEGLDIGFLDSDSAIAATGEYADEHKFGRLLDRYERTHDLVVLIAEKNTSNLEWIRFCMRQADRVVIFAHVEISPETVPVDDLLKGHDLALFGAKQTHHQIASWVDYLKPLSHFHLREGNTLTTDIDRMCRRLLSTSTGIILCGGGARALAHIGAIIGLNEAGLTIDRIGGVSMGAFLGALFAMGHKPVDVRNICMRELGPNPFDDYNFPAVSIIKAKKARRMMERVFGRCTIESLPIDFFCLSSDLVSAEPVVHRRGEIVTSVGASISIPGIAPPIAKAGQLLVDGGVLNNLPTDVMRDQGEGPIIACDLIAGEKIEDKSMQLPEVPIPGISRLFKQGSVGLPNILQTLTRASMLGSLQSRWEQQAIADLVICPNMEHIGFFDWKKIDEAIDSGYKEALKILKLAWQDGRLQRIITKRPKLVLADRGETG